MGIARQNIKSFPDSHDDNNMKTCQERFFQNIARGGVLSFRIQDKIFSNQMENFQCSSKRLVSTHDLFFYFFFKYLKAYVLMLLVWGNFTKCPIACSSACKFTSSCASGTNALHSAIPRHMLPLCGIFIEINFFLESWLVLSGMVFWICDLLCHHGRAISSQ